MSDYISREYLLNHRTHIIADGLRIPVIKLDTVINAPAVEPERPKGEWIRRSIQSADCSVCGHIQTVHGQDLTGKCHIHKALFKFCPMCGADMREGDKNE